MSITYWLNELNQYIHGPNNALGPFMEDQHGFVPPSRRSWELNMVSSIEGIPEPINEPAPPAGEEATIDYDQIFVDLIKLPVNSINDQSIGNT